MPITINDVAKKAGVSIKTVSRVINSEETVSLETRQKVLQIIDELNYVPNVAAQMLSSGKAMSIGFVTGWPFSSYYQSSLLEFILKECETYNNNLTLFSREANDQDQIIRACLGKQIDGIIMDTLPGMDTELRARIEALGMPYLILHPGSLDGLEDVSYIAIDDYQGARIAVEHLIGLGHKSIGFILENTASIQESNRFQGYRDALDSAGISFQKSWIYRKDSSIPMGYSGAKYLIANNKDLTAIFCHTDEVALGAISAIWQLGRRVPDDISVVGFDDISYASIMIPPLTTIHQPLEQMAKIAVKHLVGLINEPDTERIHKVLPINLIVRNTTQPPKPIVNGG